MGRQLQIEENKVSYPLTVYFAHAGPGKIQKIIRCAASARSTYFPYDTDDEIGLPAVIFPSAESHALFLRNINFRTRRIRL